MARQAGNYDEDKENKMQPCKHIWQGHEQHILENDTAKASNKRHHLEIRWKKMKAHWKLLQPRHRTRDTMWETKEHASRPGAKSFSQDIHEETPCEMKKQCRPSAKWPSHSQCIQPKNHAGDKELKTAHWKVIRARHPAEQGFKRQMERMLEMIPTRRPAEQSSPRQTSGRHKEQMKAHTEKSCCQGTSKQSSGRQQKGGVADPMQIDPVEASPKAILWETNENKWKQACGKMIWPSHPAKQSFWRQRKWNEMKCEMKWKQTCGRMIRPRHPAQPYGTLFSIGGVRTPHSLTSLGKKWICKRKFLVRESIGFLHVLSCFTCFSVFGPSLMDILLGLAGVDVNGQRVATLKAADSTGRCTGSMWYHMHTCTTLYNSQVAV